MEDEQKSLTWIGSSRDDLSGFPEDVKDEMGYALFVAQSGGRHSSAKALHGFTGNGVLELVDNFDGDTYRAVYTVKFDTAVYVLHAFKKKSKKGNETPKADIDLLKLRLKAAEAAHKAAAKERTNER